MFISLRRFSVLTNYPSELPYTFRYDLYSYKFSLSKKNPNILALKFEYFAIFVYIEFSFLRRLIWSNNGHDHPTLLTGLQYDENQILDPLLVFLEKQGADKESDFDQIEQVL